MNPFDLLIFNVSLYTTLYLLHLSQQIINSYDENEKNWFKKIDQLSLPNRKDKKLIVKFILISLPFWTYGLLNDSIRIILLYLSIGTFFSFFKIPTSLRPSLKDTNNFFRYTIKWMWARHDKWMKYLIFTTIINFVSYIPFVDRFFELIKHEVYPPLWVNDSVINFSTAFIILISLLGIHRMILLTAFKGAKKYVLVMLYAICLPVTTMYLFYFANNHFAINEPFAYAILKSLIFTLGIGLIIDYLFDRFFADFPWK